jgi:hypothetical protein
VALDDQSLQLALAWMEQIGSSKFIWTYRIFSDPALCAFADHCVFRGYTPNIKIGVSRYQFADHLYRPQIDAGLAQPRPAYEVSACSAVLIPIVSM